MPEKMDLSLIKLDALAEPASKLIEAVSSAVGLVYEPTHIRRKAKAEAERRKILAEAEVEATAIEQRGTRRSEYLLSRRQANIESITSGALAELPESVDEEPVDEDWIIDFFDLCQDVGSKEMQSLWSRLLAGEVAQPGTLSSRTLRLVKTLNREDAQLFSDLCGFVWVVDQLHLCFPVDVFNSKFKGVFTSYLRELDLVKSDLQWEPKKGSEADASYFGERYRFTATESTIMMAPYMLTNIGTELFAISGATAQSNEYVNETIAFLKSKNIVVTRISE